MSKDEWSIFVQNEYRKYNTRIKHSDDEIPYWEFFIEMELQYKRIKN